jgi:nitrite reductase/ring-hydroxylating ferredoxin subunit
MDVIALEALPDGVPAEAKAMIEGSAQSLLLVRQGQQVRGWLNVCPHAGRRLDWAPGKFLLTRTGALVCAAHGATFELQDGQCLSGPCRGQCLQAVALQVRDGQVVLG